MKSLIDDIAIIGAGLAGTALALSLEQQGFACRIYEGRSPSAVQIASGVILTPNGLRILDEIGVFERIRSKCWTNEYRTYKNDQDETTRKILVADKALYGYQNHRLWRTVLLDEMKLILKERNVPIEYNAKFGGITADTSDGVTFLLNGKSAFTKFLIGADGIGSTVRKHVDPNVAPEYTGTMGVLGHIQATSVQWPYQGYEKQCTIQGKPGAIFIIPEDPDGSDIMVGKQARYPDQSREKWDALMADKDRMCGFFREGYDEWGATARKILDAVCANKETMYLWPYMRMPKLKQWFSNTGRVVLVGDAVHALPPSSGQGKSLSKCRGPRLHDLSGVNQALEDAHSLVLVLSSGHTDILKALKTWQDLRQRRIDAVFDWATNAQNIQRLPEAERKRLVQEGKAKDPNTSDSYDDMRWLFYPDLDYYRF